MNKDNIVITRSDRVRVARKILLALESYTLFNTVLDVDVTTAVTNIAVRNLKRNCLGDDDKEYFETCQYIFDRCLDYILTTIRSKLNE